MLVLKEKDMLYDIFNFFSKNISQILKETIKDDDEVKLLEEIRIRNKQNIILKFNNKEQIINYLVTGRDIVETLQNICENSIYSYQKEICEGYITIKGGHRIGITGSCVLENNKIINIKYISSLNFRIARQVLGCSNSMINNIIDKENSSIYNTLIVSLPRSWKNDFSKRYSKKYK